MWKTNVYWSPVLSSVPSVPFSCSFSCSRFWISGDSMWTLTSSVVTLVVAWPFRISPLIFSSGSKAGHGWFAHTYPSSQRRQRSNSCLVFLIKKCRREQEAWDKPWSGMRTPFLMSSSLVCLVEIFLSSTESQTANNNQERLLQLLTHKPTHAWHNRGRTLPLIAKTVSATLTARSVKRPCGCSQRRGVCFLFCCTWTNS